MTSVLVIDDDPATLALMDAVFAGDGFDIRKARGPTEALTILARWTPDVVLLDIQLPGLDNGLEFARRMKANVATRRLPIIAFTAYSEQWPEAEARAAGCDGFLQKPITANMLIDAVRKVVEKAN